MTNSRSTLTTIVNWMYQYGMMRNTSETTYFLTMTMPTPLMHVSFVLDSSFFIFFVISIVTSSENRLLHCIVRIRHHLGILTNQLSAWPFHFVASFQSTQFTGAHPEDHNCTQGSMGHPFESVLYYAINHAIARYTYLYLVFFCLTPIVYWRLRVEN